MRPAISLIGSSKRKAIYLNGFVRDAGHAGFEQRFRQRLARGEVQIGEKNLAGTQQVDIPPATVPSLSRSCPARSKNFLGRIDDLRAGFDVILVRITGADAGVFLDENGVAMANQ